MPKHWPEHVFSLAKAIFGGEPAEYAMADALEELGCPTLAEHFRFARTGVHTTCFHLCAGAGCGVAEAIICGALREGGSFPREYMEELGLA